MKTTLRMFTIAFLLSLAGVLSVAWGAESVASLITQGEEITNRIKTHKAAFDAGLKKNQSLVGEGKQITADMEQLKADIAAYKSSNASIKKQTADYQSKCNGKQLNPTEFAACKAQLAQINQEINENNTAPTKLNQRQNALMARAQKYNQEVVSVPKEVKADESAYENALADQQTWLQKARTLVASPGFVPYAKKAGCPNVEKTPKSLDDIMNMSQSIITCLKKVANTN